MSTTGSCDLSLVYRENGNHSKRGKRGDTEQGEIGSQSTGGCRSVRSDNPNHLQLAQGKGK